MGNRLPAFAAALFLFGCAAAPKQDGIPDMAGLAGVWGFSGTGECETDPQVISFSEDGRWMHVSYRQGGEAGPGDVRHRFSYRVLGRTDSDLRLSLAEETRRTASGEPVSWHLVRLDANRFCWRQSDWRPGSCTRPVVRCPDGNRPATRTGRQE